MPRFSTRSDYQKFLEELENKLSPELYQLFGVNFWPVIKIQIGYCFHLDFNKKILPNNNEEFIKKSSIKSKIKKIVKFIISYFQIFIMKKLLRKNSITVLAYGFQKNNSIINGKSINIYIHPFLNHLTKMDKTYKYITIDGSNGYLNSLYQAIIRHNQFIFNFKLEISKKYTCEKKKLKMLLIEINTFLQQKNISYSSFLCSVIYNSIIKNQSNFYAEQQFLKILNPKYIWFYNYYCNEMMAISRAANKLKINIIEYQHSAITSEHFAYSNWKYNPEYTPFFPNTFWLWDEKSKQTILQNSLFSNNPKVRIIVGGNIHLQNEMNRTRRTNIDNKQRILICLQGQWIPKFIEETIQNSLDCLWYFRLHPRYPEDKTELNRLYSEIPDKIIIDEANEPDLYNVFTKVDYLITGFSGTAIEAKTFDLKVIIFGNEGFNSYKDRILSGEFHFVSNEQGLMNLLNFHKPNPHKETKMISNYIHDILD